MTRISKARTIAATRNESKSIFFRLLNTLFAAFLLLCIGLGTAKAGEFPQCDDATVEGRIIADFNWAERNTWQRGFELSELTKMHEHRTTRFDGSQVTRRYCMAKAHLTNGKHRSVYYMINDKGGFAGISWKVTHCVMGLDPWKNHDGNCRTMR